ncbi:hypothetical protein EV714DRAFT_203800 [Schizophyllum commune]
MTTDCSTTIGPTPHTQAATASESATLPRHVSTSPTSEGQLSQHGRFEGDPELSRIPRQADAARDPEAKVSMAIRDSAAQAPCSSNTALSPSLSDGQITYLLSDEAFLNHYALAGSEWGWGYGPMKAESSGSEAETDSSTAPLLDTSSGASASSASSSTQNPPQGDSSHACTICHKQFTRFVSVPSRNAPPNLTPRKYLILHAKLEAHCSSQAKYARGAYEHASGSYV